MSFNQIAEKIMYMFGISLGSPLWLAIVYFNDIRSFCLPKWQSNTFFIIENNLQKVGQSFFFTCPVGQPWYKIYLSSISFNWYRTNVNVEACYILMQFECLNSRHKLKKSEWSFASFWLFCSNDVEWKLIFEREYWIVCS